VGNGDGGNIDPKVQEGMLANQTALTQIAQEVAQRGTDIYDVTAPGLAIAEGKYQRLSSGDPAAIAQVLAPTAAAASESAAGAKANILANEPAGGEKNLALEATDAARGAQIAKTTSAATLGAPNALGALAGQGAGESIAAAGTGISGYSAGSQTLQGLGGLQLQSQQIQAEEKGNVLGSLSSLAGSGMNLFGTLATEGGWV